jgi:hypothetical protein
LGTENRYWGQILQFSLFFSLSAGNNVAETRSIATASATKFSNKVNCLREPSRAVLGAKSSMKRDQVFWHRSGTRATPRSLENSQRQAAAQVGAVMSPVSPCPRSQN